MNILILTSEYSSDTLVNRNWTKIVSYFANEWSKKHRVIVVVNKSCFPAFYYYVMKIIKYLVAYIYSKDPRFINDTKWNTPFVFDDNKVKVYNRPIIKLWPHTNFSPKRINKQVEGIDSILAGEDMQPDIIVGHWLNPQLNLISEINKKWKAKTALVLHSEVKQEIIKDPAIQEMLARIDHVGARSEFCRRILKNNLKLLNEPFVCASGIPDKYVEKKHIVRSKSFKTSKIRYITISRLLNWKCIDAAIFAVSKSNNQNYEYKIYGSGPEEKKLKKLISQNNISDKITLLGQKERDFIQSELSKFDIFILISRSETFGLVYLEAMLQGCIVIASINGGMDGIIINNQNGFLCKEGNENDLRRVLNTIQDLPQSEIERISNNAIKTAIDYSDSKVAERYLLNISQ